MIVAVALLMVAGYVAVHALAERRAEQQDANDRLAQMQRAREAER